MIVVAIIGILAAVAIPGFMQYIKSSKTAEATDNLKSISDGALSFFQAEHPTDAAGLSVITKVYPVAVASTEVPSTAQGIGVKEDPSATTTTTHLKGKPWTDLKFQISKPYYYQYSYASKAAELSGNTTFQAAANASLSETKDSAFTITGNNCGVLGVIIDATVLGTGATATAPTAEATCNMG